MRANLVAAPAFVSLAAYGLATVHEASRGRTVLAIALATLVAAQGVQHWLVCLGVL
jgi:hypothetical protein